MTQTDDLRQLLRITNLAAPLGDTRWVTLVPDSSLAEGLPPIRLTAIYDGMHSGGITAAPPGTEVKGLTGPVTFDAKMMLGCLDLLRTDEIKVVYKHPNLVLQAGGQRFTVRTGEGHPHPPARLGKDAPTVKIATAALLPAVRFLSQVAGGKQGAPVLTGIHMVAGGGTLLLEASDGVGAGQVELPLLDERDGLAPFDTVVPAADMGAALEVLGETVALRSGPTTMALIDRTTYIRLATLADAVKFPDLRKLPNEGYGLTFEVPTAQIGAVAAAGAMIHSQHTVDLTAEGGRLRFTASEQELGTYELAVGKIDTPDFELHLDADYLRVAEALGGETVTVDARHPTMRLVRVTGANDSWRYWMAEVAVSGRARSTEATA